MGDIHPPDDLDGDDPELREAIRRASILPPVVTILREGRALGLTERHVLAVSKYSDQWWDEREREMSRRMGIFR